MSISINKLTDNLGAEIEGVDISAPIDDESFEELRKAFYKHTVLVFHDQKIDEDQHIEFSRRFGPLEPTMVNDPSGGGGWINKLSNVDENGNILPVEHEKVKYLKGNVLWHSDSSYKRVPSRGALLYATEVPPIGGETEYASLKAAYQALPDDKKQELKDLVAEHSLLYSRNTITPGVVDEDLQKEVPPVPQRLIRDIPETNEKSLFIGAHASHIIGWPVEKGRSLLIELLDWATQPQFVYQHKWQPHDLVIWDNRCSLHRGRPWDNSHHKRVMRRTTLLGDGPTV